MWWMGGHFSRYDRLSRFVEDAEPLYYGLQDLWRLLQAPRNKARQSMHREYGEKMQPIVVQVVSKFDFERSKTSICITWRESQDRS